MIEVKEGEKYTGKRSIGVKVYMVLLAVPTAAFLLAALLTELIPGCKCDEGAGCHGCGMDGLVGFCLLGGFVTALGMFVFGWPIIFIVNYLAGPQED